MSDSEVRRLRKAIRQVRSRQAGTRTRYPVALRRQVLGYARERQACGASLKSIARELGLRVQLLQYWAEKTLAGRFRVVRLAPQSPAATPVAVVLVTASGTRVEGLDVASVVRVLRELS